MRPNHLKRKSACGFDAQLKRRFRKYHKVFARINIQINPQDPVKTRRTFGPLRIRAGAAGGMRRGDLGRIIKQRDLLLRVVGEPHDRSARAQPETCRKPF